MIIVAPLDRTASKIVQSINNLHESLSTFEILPAVPRTYSSLPESDPQSGTKEWEFGRAAYLNWANRKLLSSGQTEHDETNTHEHAEGLNVAGPSGTSSGRTSDEIALKMLNEETRAVADPEGLKELAREFGL